MVSLGRDRMPEDTSGEGAMILMKMDVRTTDDETITAIIQRFRAHVQQFEIDNNVEINPAHIGDCMQHMLTMAETKPGENTIRVDRPE